MSQAEPIKYGYARVSTDDQKLDLQLDALARAGVERERVFTDEASGARIADRPGLKAAFETLRPGSKLVVWKIDRLGRNLSELIQTADLVRKKGAELVSLTEDIDTSNAFGKAMYHMIGVFAQLEAVGFGDRILARFDLGIKELDHTTTVDAEDVVMMVALVQFKYGLAGFEMMAFEDASLLELGQYAIDGSQTHIQLFRQQDAINVFGGKVAILGALEKIEDLQARHGDLQAGFLEADIGGHCVSGLGAEAI